MSERVNSSGLPLCEHGVVPSVMGLVCGVCAAGVKAERDALAKKVEHYEAMVRGLE